MNNPDILYAWGYAGGSEFVGCNVVSHMYFTAPSAPPPPAAHPSSYLTAAPAPPPNAPQAFGGAQQAQYWNGFMWSNGPAFGGQSVYNNSTVVGGMYNPSNTVAAQLFRQPIRTANFHEAQPQKQNKEKTRNQKWQLNKEKREAYRKAELQTRFRDARLEESSLRAGLPKSSTNKPLTAHKKKYFEDGQNWDNPGLNPA